jgi:hypothetical protein
VDPRVEQQLHELLLAAMGDIDRRSDQIIGHVVFHVSAACSISTRGRRDCRVSREWNTTVTVPGPAVRVTSADTLTGLASGNRRTNQHELTEEIDAKMRCGLGPTAASRCLTLRVVDSMSAASMRGKGFASRLNGVLLRHLRNRRSTALIFSSSRLPTWVYRLF